MNIIDKGPDFIQSVKLEGTTLYTQTVQKDRQILELNRALQANGGVRSLDFCQPVLNMPFVEWVNFTKKYPELIHGDLQTRKKIIAKICRDHPQYVIAAKSKYHEAVNNG